MSAAAQAESIRFQFESGDVHAEGGGVSLDANCGMSVTFEESPGEMVLFALAVGRFKWLCLVRFKSGSNERVERGKRSKREREMATALVVEKPLQTMKTLKFVRKGMRL
jgi:hypothetical protein